jgi:hypothetical protein
MRMGTRLEQGVGSTVGEHNLAHDVTDDGPSRSAMTSAISSGRPERPIGIGIWSSASFMPSTASIVSVTTTSTRLARLVPRPNRPYVAPSARRRSRRAAQM